MTVQDILGEVVTIPEAVDLVNRMGYKLDRSNLLRNAQSGRLVARKSNGTWLTTRAALQELVVGLASEERGRPRATKLTWSEYEVTPTLLAALDEIDSLRQQLAAQPRNPEEQEKIRHQLAVEAIYHTNHLAGNSLSLTEVRAIIEACKVEESTTAVSVSV